MPSSAVQDTTAAAVPPLAPPSTGAPVPVASAADPRPTAEAEPVLCGHCGRTAGNGISCQGMCVADSGY
jgi:hypothetical protein